MPKPIFGINGSGMHVNMSLFKDGKNIFFDPDGDKKLSATAYSFIAGLLAHVGLLRRHQPPGQLLQASGARL